MKQMNTDQFERQISSLLKEGDLIFSSIDLLICRQVARETGSWCSHVGFVIKENNQWVVVESKVPFVCKTPLRKFLQRTRNGQVMVRRLKQPITAEQVEKLKQLTSEHIGTLYHPGFDFDSDRLFCSKLVYLVYKDAVGVRLGEILTLKTLLNQNPQASSGLWHCWYFGFVPWQRLTLTPASQIVDTQLNTIYSSV